MEIKKISEKVELEDQFDVATESCFDDCLHIRGNNEGSFNRIARYLGYKPIDLEGPKLFEAINAANACGVPTCFGYRTANTNPFW